MKFKTDKRPFTQNKETSPKEHIAIFVDALKKYSKDSIYEGGKPLLYSVVLKDLSIGTYAITPPYDAYDNNTMGIHNSFHNPLQDLFQTVNDIITKNNISVDVEVDEDKKIIKIIANEE